jgi:hypothetical protein
MKAPRGQAIAAPRRAAASALAGAAGGNWAKISATAAKISARGSPSRESVSFAQPRQTTRFVEASSTSITSVPFATSASGRGAVPAGADPDPDDVP